MSAKRRKKTPYERHIENTRRLEDDSFQRFTQKLLIRTTGRMPVSFHSTVPYCDGCVIDAHSKCGLRRVTRRCPPLQTVTCNPFTALQLQLQWPNIFLRS